MVQDKDFILSAPVEEKKVIRANASDFFYQCLKIIQ